MWIFLAIILFIWLVYLKVKEPMDSSPYDMVQEQAGTIQQLHDTIANVTMTEASIDALQSENDQATDQINQLQANLPSSAPTDAYPT